MKILVNTASEEVWNASCKCDLICATQAGAHLSAWISELDEKHVKLTDLIKIRKSQKNQYLTNHMHYMPRAINKTGCLPLETTRSHKWTCHFDLLLTHYSNS